MAECLTKTSIKIAILGAFLSLSGCNPQQPPSIDFGIEETASYTSRRQYIEQLPNRRLCEIAIQLEDRAERSTLFNTISFKHAPFSYSDARGVTPRGNRDLLYGGPYASSTDSGDIAMTELQRRYMSMRTEICPPLVRMTGREARNSGYQCYAAANAITAEQLCPGAYGGKSFSQALLDTTVSAIQRAEEEERREASRINWGSIGPVLSCSSSSGIGGTVYTSCY